MTTFDPQPSNGITLPPALQLDRQGKPKNICVFSPYVDSDSSGGTKTQQSLRTLIQDFKKKHPDVNFLEVGPPREKTSRERRAFFLHGFNDICHQCDCVILVGVWDLKDDNLMRNWWIELQCYHMFSLPVEKIHCIHLDQDAMTLGCKSNILTNLMRRMCSLVSWKKD